MWQGVYPIKWGNAKLTQNFRIRFRDKKKNPLGSLREDFIFTLQLMSVS